MKSLEEKFTRREKTKLVLECCKAYQFEYANSYSIVMGF